MSNLEQVITTGIGATIGFFVGGPAGALAGAQYGLLAGSVLFPADLPSVQGPRLEDFERLHADPGSPIAQVYGTAAVAGFRMYLGPVTEIASTEEVGGKGAPSQEVTTFTYLQTIALGLCEGPIAGVLRIWENGTLVYDVRPRQEGETDEELAARVAMSGTYASTFTLHLGTEDQQPNPTLEDEQGAGHVPGFRGLAYIVFPNRELKPDQGNRHPVFKFEVTKVTTAASTVLVAVGTPTISTPGIARSVDGGESWEYADITPGVAWRSVAYSPTLARFCAVRQGFAAISDDSGETWTEYSLPNNRDMRQVIWSTLLESFVTVTNGISDSQSLRSGDGMTWISGSAYTPTADEHIVEAPKLGRIWGRGTILYWTADGINWNSGASVPGMSGDRDFDWSPDLELLMMTDDTRVWTSPDGETWTQRTTMPSGSPTAAWSSDLGRWVVISETEVKISPNGVDWETSATLSVSMSGEKEGLWSAYWSKFVYIGSSPGSDGLGYSSPDGVTWATIPISPDVQWYSIAEGGGSAGIAASASIADIVRDLCLQAGLTETQFDVSTLEEKTVLGYVISRETTARAAIEPLRMVGLFDIVESDGKIKFPARGGAPVATLSEDELGVRFVEEEPAPAVITRKLQDIELPRQIRLKYPAISRDYEIGEQLSPARIGTVGVNDIPVECPVVLDDDQAAKLVEVMFREAWASRWSHEFMLEPVRHSLEPGDVTLLPVDGRLCRVRIVTIDDAGLLVRRVAGVRDDNGSYVSVAIATAPPRPRLVVELIGDTAVEFLDLPALRDSDGDAGFYVAAWRTGTGQSWSGARVHRSVDDGTTYQPMLAIASQAVVGEIVSAPVSGDGYTWDDEGEIVVELVSGELESRTDAAVLAGANAAAIGAHGRWQIVQFANAELIDDRTYRLTRLLLGRRGTEHLIGTTEIGDRFVLISGPGIVRAGLQISEIGAPRLYRAVSVGRGFDEAESMPFTGQGQALECFSPVDVRGARDGNDNLTISWIRRDRLSQTLRDGVPVPNSETSESYEVDILDDDTSEDVVVRTLSASTTSVVYTEAQQIEDFGSAQSSVKVRVYQLSANVGRGTPAEATV